jgi:hypothetical protein
MIQEDDANVLSKVNSVRDMYKSLLMARRICMHNSTLLNNLQLFSIIRIGSVRTLKALYNRGMPVIFIFAITSLLGVMYCC